MTAGRQQTLAIAGAILVAAVFVAANVHLVAVAFRSQPACALVEAGDPPAQRVC
jgi:hypothetical protein